MNPKRFESCNAVCALRMFCLRSLLSGIDNAYMRKLKALMRPVSDFRCSKALNRSSATTGSVASVYFSAGQHAVQWFQAGPIPSPTRTERRHFWHTGAVMALAQAERFLVMQRRCTVRINNGLPVAAPALRLHRALT